MRIDCLAVEAPPPTAWAVEKPPDTTAHLLPCEIEYTGSAIVSAYFKPSTGKRSREAAFRGRALKGETLTAPAGYVGALLQDTKPAEIADGEERRWLHKGTFESITVWKHDEAPAQDEPVFKTMKWAAIADILHGDHTEEAPPPPPPLEEPPQPEPAADPDEPAAESEEPATVPVE